MARTFQRRSVAVLLCIAVAGFLTGCQATCENIRAADLKTTVLLYLQSLRWGNYGTAATLIRRADGSLPHRDVTLLDGLRLTHFDFEILGGEAGAVRAGMIATMDYYWEDQGNVRRIVQQADWWWDQETERWYLDGNLPAFER